MKMITFIAGPIDANNYLLWEILEVVKEKNLKVKYILLTHGHFDHVLGVNEMKEALNCKVGVNKGDVTMLDNINEFAKFFAFPHVDPPKYDFLVEEGEELQFGNEKIKVICTPGHTEGGVCYLVDGKLFCGDTLFRDSYGRTDLFGGDFEKIHHSLLDIIFKLGDEIRVYPGHGPASTIGYEKVHNEINR